MLQWADRSYRNIVSCNKFGATLFNGTLLKLCPWTSRPLRKDCVICYSLSYKHCKLCYMIRRIIWLVFLNY